MYILYITTQQQFMTSFIVFQLSFRLPYMLLVIQLLIRAKFKKRKLNFRHMSYFVSNLKSYLTNFVRPH